MKTYDGSSWNDFFVRTLLCSSLVAITGQAITISGINYSLKEKEFFQTTLPKLGTHVTITDKTIIFVPTKKQIVRAFTITLPNDATVPQALAGLLPLLLFSNKNLQLTFKGQTHAANQKSIVWFHELLFRYVRKFVGTYSLGVTHAAITADGELEVHVQSKQKLSQVVADLRIISKLKLAHVAVELIAPDENTLSLQEKLISLSYTKYGASVRFATRIASFSSLTQIAFFGDDEGYDNDKAFLKGVSVVQATPLSQQDTLDLVASFSHQFSQSLMGIVETQLLLPVLALTGGSIPAEGTHGAHQELLTFLSDFLTIDFYTSEELIETEGYAKLHCPDVVGIDDL